MRIFRHPGEVKRVPEHRKAVCTCKSRRLGIQNVVARGYGASVCNGHPDSWLDGVSFENVKLTIAHDPSAPYDKAADAVVFKQARNLRLRDYEVVWEGPPSPRWRSAMAFEEVEGLTLDGVAARQAPSAPGAPAILLHQVGGAAIRDCRALPGTETFLLFSGEKTAGIRLGANDFRSCRRPFSFAQGASRKALR